MLVKWYADAAEGTGKDTRWTQEINSLIRGHIGSVMSDVRQRFLAFLWLATTDALSFECATNEAFSLKFSFFFLSGSGVPKQPEALNPELPNLNL